MTSAQGLRRLFENLLSEGQILDNPGDLEKYGKDWLRDFQANPGLILLPSSYEQVQAIVKICAQHNLPIVPSGGRTGLSGGATATRGEVVVAFDRLNKVLKIEKSDRTITCQAGTLTQTLQERAAAEGLYFPVDFASKGSSQIGGNISTNAGGIRVLRYGNTREWVLGLKVVTAQGDLLTLNGSLFKNQTGYDLRNLVIGSEGTLALIVEATMRLTSPPANLLHVLCGFSSVSKVIELFSVSRAGFPGLSVFEYFSREALAEVIEKNNLKEPLQSKCAQYALVEIESADEAASEAIEEFYAGLIESGLIDDAVVAHSRSQSLELLNYRELIPETLNANYDLHKNDVSVPVSSIPEFISRLDNNISELDKRLRVIVFGHIGDGNLHINTLNAANLPKEEFVSLYRAADSRLFQIVKELSGSISAEHGIGLLKKDYLDYSRTPQEIALMRQIKHAFDPQGILNPGKIF